MTGHVTMSVKELDRVQLMTRLAERRLTQRHAGELLGLTERQVRRLYRAFKARGAQGLASAKRGKPSHRRLAAETRRTNARATLTSARLSPIKSSPKNTSWSSASRRFVSG